MVIVLRGLEFPNLTIFIVLGLLYDASTPYRFCLRFSFFCCCIELEVVDVSDCKKILFGCKRFVVPKLDIIVGLLLASTFEGGIDGNCRIFTRFDV